MLISIYPPGKRYVILPIHLCHGCQSESWQVVLPLPWHSSHPCDAEHLLAQLWCRLHCTQRAILTPLEVSKEESPKVCLVFTARFRHLFVSAITISQLLDPFFLLFIKKKNKHTFFTLMLFLLITRGTKICVLKKIFFK